MTDLLHQKPAVASPLNIGLGSVVRTQIVSRQVLGLTHKTLLIDFALPLSVLSTLDGFKERINCVGNHYLPAASWGHYDEGGLHDLHAQTCNVLVRPARSTCLLFTGVDVDCLSFQHRQFRETQVYALVTAGVKSNAAHMVRDCGDYHEPGTINILLLSNRTLSPRAMAQALIVATEAKTAALQDLDIRSNYTPLRNAATGTGTDGVLVVQGDGPPVEYAGGHTKIGELIAKAVYAGVLEAIGRWEGLSSERSIGERLQERDLCLNERLNKRYCPELSTALEALLREPYYAGFIGTALALSDAHEAGLVGDLGAFELWCQQLAKEIAGEKIVKPRDLIKTEDLLPVLTLALNSLANGLLFRIEKADGCPPKGIL